MASHDYKTDRPTHARGCPRTYSGCDCGPKALWSRAPDGVDLPNPGKLMFYPNGTEGDEIWAAIDEATARGELGFAARASRESSPRSSGAGSGLNVV
jgi:hypothetical protein